MDAESIGHFRCVPAILVQKSDKLCSAISNGYLNPRVNAVYIDGSPRSGRVDASSIGEQSSARYDGPQLTYIAGPCVTTQLGQSVGRKLHVVQAIVAKEVAH
jgi:hypothetical protein